MEFTDQEEVQSSDKKLTFAERIRAAKKEQYAKAKERKKAYLNSPEVKARIAAQRDKLKKLRKDRSEVLKEERKACSKVLKQNLTQAKQTARQEKQDQRDAELKSLIRPALTLLKGGLEG